ncbi:MAG: WYL domain-containing protein [Deltaproteobacteria bacterium]|nr:WYL domain-containing protein [Deltaproteobacteria bacterium]
MGAATGPGRLSRLLAVARAVSSGRRLRLGTLDAGGTETARTVTPLALGWRGDHWLLAAHCHLRRALRHFRADRILHARLARGRADERLLPSGLDAAFFSLVGYLRPGDPAPVLATVRLAPPLLDLAGALFPAALQERAGPALLLCHLRVTDLLALTQLVASLGPGAELLGPPPAVTRPGDERR